MLKRCHKVSTAFENDGQHVNGIGEHVAHDVSHRRPIGFIDRHCSRYIAQITHVIAIGFLSLTEWHENGGQQDAGHPMVH